MEWCCGNDGSAASPVGGSWWGIGWSTKGGAYDGSDKLGKACSDQIYNQIIYKT